MRRRRQTLVGCWIGAVMAVIFCGRTGAMKAANLSCWTGAVMAANHQRLDWCGEGDRSWAARPVRWWLLSSAAGSVRQWLRTTATGAVITASCTWLRTLAAGPVQCIMRAVPPHRCGNGCELPPLGWCGFCCKLPRLNCCGDGCKQATAAKLVRRWLQTSAAGLVRRWSRLKIKNYVQHDDNCIIIIYYEILSHVNIRDTA